MDDLTRPATGDDDPRVGSDHRPPTGTPRWVKLFGIIAVAAVLLFVVLTLTNSAGGHGPSRHSGGVTGDQEPPAAGHTPPVQGP